MVVISYDSAAEAAEVASCVPTQWQLRHWFTWQAQYLWYCMCINYAPIKWQLCFLYNLSKFSSSMSQCSHPSDSKISCFIQFTQDNYFPFSFSDINFPTLHMHNKLYEVGYLCLNEKKINGSWVLWRKSNCGSSKVLKIHVSDNIVKKWHFYKGRINIINVGREVNLGTAKVF